MQRILNEIMKKKNTWNIMRRSSKRPSNPAYYIEDCRILNQNFFVSNLIHGSGLTLEQAWLSRTKPGLNLTKHRIRMYLENSLKLVLTKRSITVSSLSPVLALQRQRRQKRQNTVIWNEEFHLEIIRIKRILFCIW